MIEYDGFVFDIDGTAVPEGADSVDPALVDAFGQMDPDTVTIAATGRTARFALPIMQALDLRHESVVANGAEIINPTTFEIVWNRNLSSEQVLGLIAICSEYKHRFILGGDPSGVIESASGREARATPVAFLMDAPREDAEAVLERALQIPDVFAYLSKSWAGDGYLFDVNVGHAQARKDIALAEVYDRNNLDPTTLIGIGDADNDLYLFEAVGHRIAVANADVVLLEAADEIVCSQEEGGLIEVAKRFSV